MRQRERVRERERRGDREGEERRRVVGETRRGEGRRGEAKRGERRREGRGEMTEIVSQRNEAEEIKKQHK